MRLMWRKLIRENQAASVRGRSESWQGMATQEAVFEEDLNRNILNETLCLSLMWRKLAVSAIRRGVKGGGRRRRECIMSIDSCLCTSLALFMVLSCLCEIAYGINIFMSGRM